MSFEQHSGKFPSDMEDYFASTFDRERIWRLDLPVLEHPVSAFAWMLDYPFWSTNPPEPRFDLKPIDVLVKPAVNERHWSRTMNANIEYPIDVAIFQRGLIVLDGLHRLLKLKHLQISRVNYRLVPGSEIARVA